MVRILSLIIILVTLAVPSLADSGRLARFFPEPKQTMRYSGAPLRVIAAPQLPQPHIDTFNEGVELNNQGLNEMRRKNFEQACRLFAQACAKVPGETGFWSNYLIAARRIKGEEEKAIRIATQIMAMNPADHQAPYIAGLLYLNELKQPQKAIPFLEYALQASADDSAMATALATAYDQCGYADDAFEILKKHAHRSPGDPYPSYLLGLQYLERRDYNAAIRALNSARSNDDKGFAHDAWIRARYFAGQLDGLENDCRMVLRRFPEVMNRRSLERILLSLQPGDFKMIETITTKLSVPSTIEKLDFLIKPVPDSRNHQQVDLVSAEFVSRNKIIKASLENREAGRLRISVPKEALAPEFTLSLTSRIRTQAMLGTRVNGGDAAYPDIQALANDPLLSLDNSVLNSLYERIKQMPGNYVQNAAMAVSDGLVYKENFEDHSVEWALANPDSCDCTEYSRLLTALCLKNAIPARVATGFLVKQELIDAETSVGHAWCEVFFKGKGWVPIDATLQANMHWAYFGNLLSDQILFDYLYNHKRTRISIDFVSTRPDLQVNLSNSYRISYW